MAPSFPPQYYNKQGDASADVVLYNEAFGGGPLVYWDMLKSWREEGSLKGMRAIPFEAGKEARL